MFDPVDQPGFRARWRNRHDARADIPELADTCQSGAEEAYQRARTRLWRSPIAWAVSLVLCGAALAWIVLIVSGERRLFGKNDWSWLVLGPLNGMFGGLLVWVFFLLNRRRLRRYVRAELGTHCRDCDYDLRGTPDLPHPARARCPECGRPIPRNVHRPTIFNAPPAATDADAAPADPGAR